MDHSKQVVVIEGIDGAGKSSVCKHLSENHGYSYMTQPEDSWVGEVARKALKEDVEPACDLFLHMAAHANQQPKLKTQLESGSVVMDRYYHSRVAYQSVQTQFTAEEIEEMHLGWSVEPSKVILLDLPAEVALERKIGATDKFEKIDFLSEVRSVYLDFFGQRDDVEVVNVERPIEEVFEAVESRLPH